MAVAFGTSTTANTGTASATSLTVNVPASTANGDLLILFAVNGYTEAFNALSGWTALIDTTDNISPSQLHATIWYRIASSEPASYNVTAVNATPISASMLRYTGVDQVSPIRTSTSTSPSTASATSSTPGSLTGISNGDMAVISYLTSIAAAATTYTLTMPGSGWNGRTNVVTSSTTASTWNADHGCVDKAFGTDTPTATSSRADTGWVVASLAIAADSRQRGQQRVLGQAVNRAANF